jgi:hypothetical protein
MQIDHSVKPSEYLVIHLPPIKQAALRSEAVATFVALALLFAVLLAVIVFHMFSVTARLAFGAVSLYFSPFLLVDAVYRLFSARQTRIVLMDSEIEYHTVGYSVIAPAQSTFTITTIRRQWHLVDCLLLKGSQFEGSRLFLWLSGCIDFEDIIPIGDFHDWQHTPPGQFILQQLEPDQRSGTSSADYAHRRSAHDNVPSYLPVARVTTLLRSQLAPHDISSAITLPEHRSNGVVRHL